jgi:hypothetical protein
MRIRTFASCSAALIGADPVTGGDRASVPADCRFQVAGGDERGPEPFGDIALVAPAIAEPLFERAHAFELPFGLVALELRLHDDGLERQLQRGRTTPRRRTRPPTRLGAFASGPSRRKTQSGSP